MISKSRIKYLDGLRGLAILLVTLWHLYGPTYAYYLPFHDKYSVIPIRLFWVGVYLFFLISGFVILMTLDRCPNLTAFAIKRWLRLFPAMFIVSIVLLAFVQTGLGPYCDRGAINLIPGLFFVSPSLINALVGATIQSMDGPFWSLYVEVCFYALFGAAYFLIGARAAIGFILATFIVAFSSQWLVPYIGSNLFTRFASAMDWLGFIHFGWFASGALFYLYSETQHPMTIALAIGVGCISAFAINLRGLGFAEYTALLSTVAIFAAVTAWHWPKRFLSGRILVYFGFISYPLYLLHNNIGIGLTRWIGENAAIPDALTPVLPIMLVIFVSWLIAELAEPQAQRLLSRIPLFQVPLLERTAGN